MLPPELELPLVELEFCSLSVSMVTGSQELRLRGTPDLHRENWKLSQARERTKPYFTALRRLFLLEYPSTRLLAQLCSITGDRGCQGSEITQKLYLWFKSFITTVRNVTRTFSCFYCHAPVGSYSILNS